MCLPFDRIAKMKTEKRQKTQEKKQKLMESRKSLASVRYARIWLPLLVFKLKSSPPLFLSMSFPL